MQKDETQKHFLFEKEKIYLVELDCELDFPENINGRATGKSTIGRLDIITRLITQDSTEYDVVEAGYKGRLYLLVLPQTFSIRVAVGASLNQLRLFSGPPHASIITRSIINDFGTPFWYVREPDGGYEPSVSIIKEHRKSWTADPTLFDLTVDLSDNDLNYIYKAKSDSKDEIDLRKGKDSYDPKLYFEKVKVVEEGAERSVLLNQKCFYIMKSKERLYIPKDVAVEVIAISERIGDIRIHYAGFAHPWFGRHGDEKKPGTPLIFEVRATDMKTKLYDGSLLAKIQLFRMSAEAIKIEEKDSSPYDRQELKLSSVFKDWEN